MRYYSIRISDPQTGQIFVPNVGGRPGFSLVPFGDTTWTYTSLNANAIVSQVGSTNPYAQMVEMDLPVTFAHLPGGTAAGFVRIWGVGLQEIAQASDLNFANIVVYGGMARGLPLANPAQSNLLVAGQVSQCFGNWAGVDQSLSIFVWPSGASPSAAQTTGNPSDTSTIPALATNETPANLTFQWTDGQPLLEALVPCLSTAFPKTTVVGAVHANLTWVGAAATGYFANLQQLAQYINKKTLSMISGYAPNGDYLGVSLAVRNNAILITDNTTRTTPVQITFFDLIGQPTWGAAQQVQVTTVMRGDIAVGDYVVLPPSPQTLTAGALTQFQRVPNALGNAYSTVKNNTTFSGTFFVQAVRHVGNSRGPGGMAWTTVLDLLAIPPASPSQATSTPTTTVVDELPVLYKPNNAYAFYLPN